MAVSSQQYLRPPAIAPGPTRPARRRPVPTRPAGAPLRHRGAGVATACGGPNRRRPITAATTAGLALLAGLVTVWLGVVAQIGAAAGGSSAGVPDRLAVVRVQSGETLPQLASRVAPGASRSEVVDRIRELNRLDSAAVQAGQTLIAPIG